ncbi:MAG TPA: SulP family inorganic anion transporter [Beijerinckiaceae bacterium]|nr:SulP family inorganic anion transporter [Beijerinckiaceae bacterium]
MKQAVGARSPRSDGTGRGWAAFRSFAGYRAAFLTVDLVAGLTLAAIAIPEQMATARLGGFSPQFGFFAFVAGSVAFVAFGGSRFLSSGADSTITPIFAGALALLATAGSPHYAMLAAALSLMVGVLLVAGGYFRLGWIADLLSVPVTTGFLAGVSFHILLSQTPSVLGLPSTGGSMLQRVAMIGAHLADSNPLTTAIGLGVLAIIALSERLSARIPGALFGLVLATGAVMLFGLQNRGVPVLGAISGSLPTLAIPSLSFAQFARLLPLSLVIAVVTMVQTAATTRSFPSDPDQPPDVDRDFIGVGAGSVLAGLFGAFPVDASPPRTAIVSETGGRSQLAGLAAAAIVLAVLAFGANLLRDIPHAALGGVLLFVALRIIRLRQIIAIYRQSFGEFLLVVATWAAIVLLPIEQGVAIGIALSLLHGIWSTTRAHVLFFERVPGTTIWWPKSPTKPGETLPGVVVAAFQAPLSFLNAYGFRSGVLAGLRGRPEPVKLVILEATAILDIDFTAAQILADLIRQCHADHVDFAIARLESVRAQNALSRFGLDTELGADRLFRSVDEAVRALAGKAKAFSSEVDAGTRDDATAYQSEAGL